jgi:hypothetical protein
MRRFSAAPPRVASAKAAPARVGLRAVLPRPTNVLLATRGALLNHPGMRCLSALLLLATVGLAGCRGGDRRAWTICYRIYDQCGERIGDLTREQCETTMAQQLPRALDSLVSCTRAQPCPDITRSCVGKHAPALLPRR